MPVGNRFERLRALGVTGLVVAASAWPLVRGQDDFPLSTYPMFSSRRPDVAWIARASHQREAEGELAPLSPRLVAASDEPMQAVSTLNQALAGGGSSALQLCREIATRAASTDLSGWIVLDLAQFEVIGYFRGAPPRAVRAMARCPVPAESPR